MEEQRYKAVLSDIIMDYKFVKWGFFWKMFYLVTVLPFIDDALCMIMLTKSTFVLEITV